MNIDDLENKLGIANLSDADKLALVESIKQNVAASKASIKVQEAGQYASLVVDAIKRIKSDLETRFAELNGTVVAKADSLKDGKDGLQGAKGEKGDRGFDGVNGKDGYNGKDGVDGVDGKDGTGVSDAYIDFDGSLVIKLTDGTELNVGEVVPMDVAEKIKIIGNGGGTSQAVLDSIASLQTQIDTLIPSQTGNSGKYLTTNGTSTSWASIAAGGLSYQGTWNATTNTPTLVSSTGTNGYYYIVATAGSTNLNGITDWQIGDWLLFNGFTWQKIDQTNLVTSVAGRTGAVTLTSTDVGLANVENKSSATIRGEITSSNVTTALGYTPYNATNPNGYTTNTGTVTSVAALTLGTTGTDLSSTVANGTTTPVITLNVPTASAANRGALSSTDWSTFNGKQAALVSGTNIKTVNGTSLLGSGDVGVGVTSVTGTSPVASSGGATPAISLATGYGDTKNPYASKTANYVLAAPNGSAGAPTFRAVVAADIPTLNQNTTGTASNVTGTVAIANGGTGATTAGAALTALGAYAASNPSGYTSNTGTVTSITAGTGLSGGTITTSGTVALANTAVTAGAYTLANITVDAQGRITSASNGSAGTGTVTSVGMTTPTGLTVTGSPVTTSGTLALSMTSGYAIPTTSSQTNWDTAFTDRNKWDGGATGLTASTGRTSLGVTATGADTTYAYRANNLSDLANVTTARSNLGLGSAATLTAGSANGVATLDSGGKVPSGQLPAIAITDTFVVVSQAAMLALTAETGDVAVRTDVNKSFILTASPASTLGNWQELLTPTDAVTSVAGRTGAVTLSTSDISGLGTIATQAANSVNITGGSITGITDLAVADGGTGSSTASGARTNLGLVIGTDVLAPNGSAASLTSFPTFNQNTTGTASNVTGTVAVANGGTGATTAAVARTNLGATTLGGNLYTVTNPSAITFPRFNADNTVSSLDAASFRTAIGAGTSSTTGTVTSVGGTGTVSGLSLSGTVTSSGNLTLGGTLSVTPSNFASQTANTVLAAPNGVAGTPTFRTLVSADIPTLNQNTTGTASNVTGTVAVANGGTGSTTASGARTNLGLVIGTDVLSPTGSAASLTSFPTFNQNTTGTASNVTGTVAIANGGTGQTTASAGFNALSPVTSTGDLIVGNGVNSATRLAIGTNGYVLTSNGTTATWVAAAGGGASISNDTSTSTNVYPLFAAATSGTPTTVYTSNAKYLYKPSTGELQSSHMVSANGIHVNSQTIATSYTIASGQSGSSAGPISISSGVTVTVSSGSTWVVL